jgi:endonuclease/exonuclease/phosphatase family protein
MRLLFWNTKRLNNAKLLSALAREHNADLLVLAEPGTSLAALLPALNIGQETLFFPDASPGLSRRLQIFYRYSPAAVRSLEDVADVAVREIAAPPRQSVLLVAAHLSSKLHQKTEDQSMSVARIRRIVERSEREVGHNRTVIIGDLNMDPFEHGIVGAEGVHAVMDRRVASRTSRVLRDEEYRFFYNPMWTLLGDRSGQPTGSYYYDSSSHVNYYWHIFDQVLLRPELVAGFVPERDVRILRSADGTQLVRGKDERPDDRISDHLPILVNLESLEEI